MQHSPRRFAQAAIGAIAAVALVSLVAPQPAGAGAQNDIAPEINVKNWYWGPGNRWSYKHTSRIFPSATIYRGSGPIVKLDYALRDLNEVSFVNPITRLRMSIAQMYSATDTDAFLVMKDGKIVTEQYFNGMKPKDRHLLVSVPKSVLNTTQRVLTARL